ncbi:4458_t:CDS:2 [Funneliformis geosporum]|uniref:4458_t:CDS:1 n=1 Tax=Funneliformis geosporum TaxID=1117311 RepID=A0A9W4SER7_9GLOM|nr:4458_t:CDS:2 [Funneliformis geosporum]
MKVDQLKYIDSMQFMNSSLASLTKNLGANHSIISQHFKKLGYIDEQLTLVLHKRVYFYDYIDLQNRFKKTELLLYHKFHSEYHDIYFKTDIFSLADIWIVFQKMSMEYYELDPSHYISIPALSWDGMLKMIGVKIELFTNMVIHDFIEKVKRDGISIAC